MSFFDTPHNGYGSHPNPVMIFTIVKEDELTDLKTHCNNLQINFERWFVGPGTDVHESLNPGNIAYYPQYNCIRNVDQIPFMESVSLTTFIYSLRRHPKHIGSMFIKSETIEQRDHILTYFESQGYRKHAIYFGHELSVLVNEELKTLMVHRNERADENEREGSYPVMTYEDFKIYMS